MLITLIYKSMIVRYAFKFFLFMQLAILVISTSLVAEVQTFYVDAGLNNPKRLVLEYDRNYKFEESINNSALKSCLPDYGSVQEMKNFEYAKRVVYNVYKECGNTVTTRNIIKYGLLGGIVVTSAAVTAVTAVPAPPVSAVSASIGTAFTPVMLGELKSETAKCVFKAFIESSEISTTKTSTKQLTDIFFLLKDWSSYFESLSKTVPELVSGKGMKDFNSIAEFISATPERTEENLDRINIAQDTANSVNDLFIGSTRLSINKAIDAFSDCDIKGARNFLELSIKAAKVECQTYGMKYRMMEDSIEKAINRNYWHFSNITARIPADDQLDNLNKEQVGAYNGLLRFSNVFEEIEQLKDKISDREKNLVLISMDYNRQLQALKNKDSVIEMCKGFSALEEYLKPFSPKCKKKILSVFSLERDTKQLLDHINDTARQLSSSQWNDLDQISASLSSCSKIEQIEKKLGKLESSVKNTPIYMYMDSECKLADQSSFNKEFNIVKKHIEKKKRECEKPTIDKPNVNYGHMCPELNPGDPDRPNLKNYKFDTNENPNDKTYLKCSYFDDGMLVYQVPYQNGELHGTEITYYAGSPHRLKSINNYKKGKLDGTSNFWYIVPGSGNYYKMTETLTKNGKTKKSIQFNENGLIYKKSIHKDNSVYNYKYNKKGNLTECYVAHYYKTADSMFTQVKTKYFAPGKGFCTSE